MISPRQLSDKRYLSADVNVIYDENPHIVTIWDISFILLCLWIIIIYLLILL
jgi:hypothetical protein